MAKHLNNRDIDSIVNLIRGWQEPKLSWLAICEAAEPLVGKLPSRQSLNAHEAIVTAYQTKKEALKGRGRKNPRPAREGANKQVISSQADSLIKISRIWADFFPANTSNQPI